MQRREFLWAASGLGGLIALGNPLPKRPSGMRVLFLSDFHSRLDRRVPEALERVANEVNRLKPDFILGGGDYIHGGFRGTEEVARERFELFRSFVDQLKAPAHWIIGNHDFVGAVDDKGKLLSGDPTALFREYMGVERLYGAFDLGDWHVIYLQTVDVVGDEFDYRGWVNDGQMNWLKKHLEQVSLEQPILLRSHIPFRTTFMQVNEAPTSGLRTGLVVENANEVITLFKEHNLKAVLQGHLHLNERIYWNDIAFIMGGAVCGRWWQGDNLGTEEGFAELDISSSRSIQHQYHDYGWEA